MGSDAATIRKALEETDPKMLADLDAIKATFGARLIALRIDHAGIRIGWHEYERFIDGTFKLRASSAPDAARREWEEIKARARTSGRSAKGRR